MAQHDLTTTPVQIGRAGQQVVVSNLGPDTVYLGYANDVDSTNGLPVPVSSGYEFPHDLTKDLFAVSGGTSDIRTLVVG